MDFKTLKENESKYAMQTQARASIAFVTGKNATLADAYGNEYVDFYGGGGVNVLGYGDVDFVQALSVQSAKLINVGGLFYTEERAELYRSLIEGSDFTRVLLVNSGSEAIDAAIKMVRKYFFNYLKPRTVVLSAATARHGSTYGAISLGSDKQRRAFKPVPDGFRTVEFNDIDSLKRALEDSDVCAVILETMQQDTGMQMLAYEYLTAAYALCRAKGVFLILDESHTGMGRTGSFYSYARYGVIPDAVILADALGNGVPVAALLARGDLAEVLRNGDHPSTLGGNSLSCRAALTTLAKVRSKKCIDAVAYASGELLDALNSLKSLPSTVVDVRGEGLIFGLELANGIKTTEVVAAMLAKGYILGYGNNVLKFTPPYCVTKKEIDSMLYALREVLKSVRA